MHRLCTPPDDERVRSGFWRELSWALAIGVAVLAAVVLVLQLVAWVRGQPGPGPLTTGAHLVVAAVAVLAARFAADRTGWPARSAIAAVLVLTGTTMWIFWWA